MRMYSFNITGETVYIWSTNPEYAVAKARRFGRHFFNTTFLRDMKDIAVPTQEQVVLANQINVVLNEPQYHPPSCFAGAEQALLSAFRQEGI